MEGGTPLHVLKKYKAVLLSGLLVVVFCVAAYCAVGRADSADSQYTYAEHIFQDDTVNEINIEIDEADWQDMLEKRILRLTAKRSEMWQSARRATTA